MINYLLGAATAAALFAMPAAAAVVVTYENAGVQNTSAMFDFVGVETFEGYATGSGQTLASTFGGSAISGTYRNLRVDSANRFGSAGGTGKHAVAASAVAGYDLALTTARPEGINYFGYWLSALDRGNVVELYKGATKVYTFSPADVIIALGVAPIAIAAIPIQPLPARIQASPTPS